MGGAAPPTEASSAPSRCRRPRAAHQLWSSCHPPVTTNIVSVLPWGYAMGKETWASSSSRLERHYVAFLLPFFSVRKPAEESHGTLSVMYWLEGPSEGRRRSFLRLPALLCSTVPLGPDLELNAAYGRTRSWLTETTFLAEPSQKFIF